MFCIINIAAAIAFLVLTGGWGALLGAPGLAIFAGFTGFVWSVLFLCSGTKCLAKWVASWSLGRGRSHAARVAPLRHVLCASRAKDVPEKTHLHLPPPRGLPGLIEALFSFIWGAFFLAVGAVMASAIGATGVCVSDARAADAASIEASTASLIASASTMIDAATSGMLDALASSLATRRLLASPTVLASPIGGRRALRAALPLMDFGGASRAFLVSLCASSVVLCVAGFVGFLLFAVGGGLAIKCDLLRGRGAWAPTCARADDAFRVCLF